MLLKSDVDSRSTRYWKNKNYGFYFRYDECELGRACSCVLSVKRNCRPPLRSAKQISDFKGTRNACIFEDDWKENERTEYFVSWKFANKTHCWLRSRVLKRGKGKLKKLQEAFEATRKQIVFWKSNYCDNLWSSLRLKNNHEQSFSKNINRWSNYGQGDWLTYAY